MKLTIAIQNKEIEKANSKYAKLLLEKIINNKKNLYFEENIAGNKNNPKKLWWTSLGMSSEGERQSKILLKENGVVYFNSKGNTITFWLLRTTEDNYKQIRNEYEGFVLHNIEVTTVDEFMSCQGFWKRLNFWQIS